MRVLVTGITGAIGGQLAPALVDAGHQVRGVSRLPPPSPGLEVVAADAITGVGLAAALADVEVAYYLIHSMESAAGPDFQSAERAGAENFIAAAAEAGVRRVVYLGGLQPQPGADPSAHLRSRLTVERILREGAGAGGIECVALRASIVIGAQSRSFRFLVRLIERLPLLVLPAWQSYRTSPVDGRDLQAALVAACTLPLAADTQLDLTGPEVVTYGQLIQRIRDHMLLRRPSVVLPRLSVTGFASRVAASVAGEDHALVGPLMQGLTGDLLAAGTSATEVLGVRVHSLDSAIERALRDWESNEALRGR